MTCKKIQIYRAYNCVKYVPV